MSLASRWEAATGAGSWNWKLTRSKLCHTGLYQLQSQFTLLLSHTDIKLELRNQHFLVPRMTVDETIYKHQEVSIGHPLVHTELKHRQMQRLQNCLGQASFSLSIKKKKVGCKGNCEQKHWCRQELKIEVLQHITFSPTFSLLSSIFI